MYCDYNELKRKLRKLKQLEKSIRFGYYDAGGTMKQLEGRQDLVWNDFFALREDSERSTRYPISKIASMSKDEYKEMVNEFLTYVYIRAYREKGMQQFNYYDPEMLYQIGLPYTADEVAVKQRFRELVKKYHPDTGGDSEKFLELMKKFEELR